MRGDDGYREHVWNKRGSRFQLPRVPRPSLKTLARALPGIGIVSLSFVSFLAVPAESPPPPPAVAAEPIATVEPTPTATEIATEPTPAEQPSPQPPQACHPRGIGTHTEPPAPKASAATTIVYESHGSLWIYDVASNSRRLLVKGGDECGYNRPLFIDRGTVAFVNGNDVDAVDIVTGAVRKFKTNLANDDWQKDWLGDYSIAPGGKIVAALGSDGRETFQLAVSSIQTGRLLFGKRLGFICGCDGGPSIVLTWSRDGSLLLVSVPSKTNDSLVYVFDRTGRRLTAPTAGDSPRWIGSSHSFVYNAYGTAPGSWTRFDLRTGARALLLRSAALGFPVVSPDGTKIAFTDESAMRVVVYDSATHASRTLGGNHAFPLWLDDDHLAVSAVAPCNCEYPAYSTTGAVGSISVSTGRTVRMGLTDTADADVLY